MNCLLTGGAGIVGSHIIFEWIHKALIEKTVDHLFVVIRDSEFYHLKIKPTKSYKLKTKKEYKKLFLYLTSGNINLQIKNKK